MFHINVRFYNLNIHRLRTLTWGKWRFNSNKMMLLRFLHFASLDFISHINDGHGQPTEWLSIWLSCSSRISFSLRSYTLFSSCTCTLPQRSDKIFTFSFIFVKVHNNNLMWLSVGLVDREQRHSTIINVARTKITIFVIVVVVDHLPMLRCRITLWYFCNVQI